MHLDNMEQIQKRVLEDMDLSEENDDARLREKIEEKVWEHGKCHLISLEEEQRYVQEIFCSLRKLDVLEELLQDESVTEIMVNGYQKIFYEKAGRLYTWDKQFAGREKLEDVIQKMVGKNNRVVNEAMPIADARLEDGSRVHIVLEPTAIDGSCITIRKFPKEPMTMKRLIELQTLSEEAATGIYIGGWDNCSLLMTSLILVFVFAIIQILVRKKSAKSEIPFVPFVLSAYMLYLGGQMI